MSADSKEIREGFLSRWSRLKVEQPAAAPAVPVEAQPTAQAEAAPPVLPAIEDLTIESDFRGFFNPKVDESLRRAALRKLFTDPHFNVMDGLDVYIEDYSKTEPIPAAMLAGLKQTQRILRWAEGKDEEVEGEADEGEGKLEDTTQSDSDAAALPDAPQST